MSPALFEGRKRTSGLRSLPCTRTSGLSWIVATVTPPEVALILGTFPGDGNPYGRAAVINSKLLPAISPRWLLCYEEHDREAVHLQKALPKHWLNSAETIRVEGCPTLGDGCTR